MSPVPPDAPRIRAIGTAVPESSVPQDAVLAIMARAHRLDAAGERRLRALYRKSRIARRQIAISDERGPLGLLSGHLEDPDGVPAAGTGARMEVFRERAAPLVERACRDAFAQPGAPDPSAIDHVLVASCTGFVAPGLDVVLTKALGLRPDVSRTLIGFQGCQAGLTALRLAETACRADPSASVLLACVELCTLHFQADATDDNLLANSLFGDGAAAAIVSGAQVARTGAPSLAVTRTATWLSPDSLGEMTWRVGDRGFELHLSSYLPRLLGMDVRPFLVGRLGLEPGEISTSFWAIHPGGAAILEALERSLELPERALDASRSVLQRHGNMSSPTIWFVLRELMDEGVAGRGLALAFGPGLTIEAARLVASP